MKIRSKVPNENIHGETIFLCFLKFCDENSLKRPQWKPSPKIEIPHPENHVLKVFRFRSWKPRAWKSRPQSWDPKSWKPCPDLFAWPPWPALPVRQTLRKVTADNFPQWVFSGAKVAELRQRQSGPDPARHPVLDVSYSALECPNLDWEQEIPSAGPGLWLAPELRHRRVHGRTKWIYSSKDLS
jgi:hypothetical protein